MLSRITPENVRLEIKDPVNPKALEQAKAIIAELHSSSSSSGGPISSKALLGIAKRFGDVTEDETSLLVTKEECKAAFDGLQESERTALVNIHKRVLAFAEAQRKSIQDMQIDIPGGKAGHTVSPCKAAGCYAPGGRYPLPSSVVMTTVTARAAGCNIVVLASPRPAPITLAAAHVCGCDVFLKIGGAQAVAAMAHGVSDDNDGKELLPSCDVIVGPGNQWVTAAKSIVHGRVGIDMLAGPSEVLVICDETANVKIVAADLIAQAEHDVVARAIIISTSSDMIDSVNKEVESQVATLPEPNRSTTIEALKQSFAILCDSIEQCIEMSDLIAPEHLEVQTKDAWKDGMACANYGGLFIGETAAEVLGDYGAGPNHTLPTGGTGRYTGGLSVFDFLRIRTWMKIDDREKCQDMVKDTTIMARLEGLEGHARAAEARKL